MSERRFLYFALGVMTVVCVGAATNQIVPLVPAGIALSNTGITFPDGSVQTTAAASDVRRGFYLANPVPANQALTACDAGYHMASFWEIRDVSNLRYAREVSNEFWHAAYDMGSGPPGDVEGFVRTGHWTGSATTVAGAASCLQWTSISASDVGTTVQLREDWTVAGQAASPWVARTVSCAVSTWRVWCAQD